MTKTTTSSRPAPWLDIMTTWLGVSEIRGANDNPKIVAMFRAAGHPEVTDDETAWCSACCCAAVAASGFAIPPVSINLMARSWLDHADKLARPEVGCIAIWKRGKTGWQGHVNVVAEISADGKTVLCIGGNQGAGEVSYATHRIDSDQLLGWRWPRKAVKTVRPPPDPAVVAEPPKPKPVTARELARVSRKVSLALQLRNAAAAVLTAIGGLFSLDTFGVAKGAVEDARALAADNALILGIALAFLAVTAGQYVLRLSINAYREGRYVPSGEK